MCQTNTKLKVIYIWHFVAVPSNVDHQHFREGLLDLKVTDALGAFLSHKTILVFSRSEFPKMVNHDPLCIFQRKTFGVVAAVNDLVCDYDLHKVVEMLLLNLWCFHARALFCL
jgi:hypothetical protein